MQDLLKNSFEYIVISLIGDIFYFPFWWYTKGVKEVIKFCWMEIKDGEKYFALSIWIRNIFNPMYSQYDLQGRIVSFFIRLIQIIFRTIFLVIWSILVLGLILLWIFLPVLVIYEIYMLISIIRL